MNMDSLSNCFSLPFDRPCHKDQFIVDFEERLEHHSTDLNDHASRLDPAYSTPGPLYSCSTPAPFYKQDVWGAAEGGAHAGSGHGHTNTPGPPPQGRPLQACLALPCRRAWTHHQVRQRQWAHPIRLGQPSALSCTAALLMPSCRPA